MGEQQAAGAYNRSLAPPSLGDDEFPEAPRSDPRLPHRRAHVQAQVKELEARTPILAGDYRRTQAQALQALRSKALTAAEVAMHAYASALAPVSAIRQASRWAPTMSSL